MNNEAHTAPHTTFLDTIGAETLPGDECRFAAEPETLAELDAVDTVIPLSHYGALSIKGADAEKFLQGQITCSSADVTTTLSTPGAHCTPKGRAITSFQLARIEADHFLLRMRRDLLDISAQAFAKYIVFSKAKLQRADDLIGIGLHGPNTAALVRELAGDLPGAINATIAHGTGFILQRDTEGTWFECWLAADAANDLWQRASGTHKPVGTRYWHWLTIRVGLAEVCAATTDTFIPQMLNYHLTGAINFKKGCYTGQEIVARAYYRGQVKRHLLRAGVTTEPPAPGAAISDANGRVVGTVVNSVLLAPNLSELLGVTGEDDNNIEKLLINGVNLRPEPLPYAIP
ncbi:MAG: hypothetical protein JWM78_1180 [Verrucomicrobiaceae bacterium]|nr:hypothetical protein [Verrucomicrobiaceae bacterium]